MDTGNISGTVRDAAGAAVPAAKVTIRNTRTGITSEVASNTEGIFVSPPLRPGEYVVEVEATGFERAAQSLELTVSQRVSMSFELKVGSVSTSIDVQAAPALLQTESATLSNLRSERQIKDLPLNGRNFANLIGLAAGRCPRRRRRWARRSR